jgi:hypothetical protein
MDRPEEIERSIAATRESLDQKLEALEVKVRRLHPRNYARELALVAAAAGLSFAAAWWWRARRRRRPALRTPRAVPPSVGLDRSVAGL